MIKNYFFTLAVTTSLLLAACSNLSKSESDLRRQFLAATPLGTSMEDAPNMIKRKLKPKGGVHIRDRVPCRDLSSRNKSIGIHSIRANMGWYYWGVTEATTIGEWCFDNQHRLIEIVVYKEVREQH